MASRWASNLVTGPMFIAKIGSMWSRGLFYCSRRAFDSVRNLQRHKRLMHDEIIAAYVGRPRFVPP